MCQKDSPFSYFILSKTRILRDRDHFAHFTIREAVDLIEEVKPKTAYLTHFNHEVETHELLDRRLPENVHPAYDGLVIEINGK